MPNSLSAKSVKNASRKTPTATPIPAVSTEEKILSAARDEFMEKGFAETRMQAIADRAGVNKALLHYYFRSKDRLLEIIIRDIITKIWGQVRIDLTTSPVPDLRTIIKTIVTAYINMFSENTKFPVMILQQIQTNSRYLPLIIDTVFNGLGDMPKKVSAILNANQKNGTIRKTQITHLVINIAGMIMMTFVAQPIVGIIAQKTHIPIQYNDAFYRERIEAITSMICDGLFVKEQNT
jgi:TetR/AcrR family transcriptional regulator